MTLNVKNSPAPRPLHTTTTRAPANATPTAPSGAANGAASASPTAQVQPQKPAISAPPGYHQDQLGKAQVPSQAPTGHAAFQSKQDVAALNSRRSSVFATRSPPGGASGPVSSAQSKQIEQLQAPTQVSARGASKTEQDFDALAQKHGVSCSTRIFQSDRLSGTAAQEFKGARNGVCIAMSSEWIRSGIQDAKAGNGNQSQLFQMLAENGGKTDINPHFIQLQHQSLESLSNINQLVGKQQAALDDLRKTNELSKAPEPSKWTPWVPPRPDANVLQQKFDAYKTAEAAANKAKQTELNRLVGGVSQGVPGPSAECSKLTNDFSGQFSNGFHQVSIFKPNGSGGHDMAIHMGDKPKLIDPNTGVMEFQSKAQLNSFMKDHMRTFYPDYSAGKFESTHYPS